MNGMMAQIAVVGHSEDKVRDTIYFFERFGLTAVGADGIDSLRAALRNSHAEEVLLLSDSKVAGDDAVLLHVCAQNTNPADAALAIIRHHHEEQKCNGS